MPLQEAVEVREELVVEDRRVADARLAQLTASGVAMPSEATTHAW